MTLSFVIICELNSACFVLDLSGQKHYSNEQIDFLDKFCKDNPWADSTQIESIVKHTGLSELMVKVRIPKFLSVFVVTFCL